MNKARGGRERRRKGEKGEGREGGRERRVQGENGLIVREEKEREKGKESWKEETGKKGKGNERTKVWRESRPVARRVQGHVLPRFIPEGGHKGAHYLRQKRRKWKIEKKETKNERKKEKGEKIGMKSSFCYLMCKASFFVQIKEKFCAFWNRL